MIKRVQELERRLRLLTAELIATKARLQAVDDRVMQLAGGMPGMFGPSGAVAFGRAVGPIGARVGTTLGSGDFRFADAAGGVLAEGSGPVEKCKNLVVKEIADDAWLLLNKEPKHWVVVGVGDPCNDLSDPA